MKKISLIIIFLFIIISGCSNNEPKITCQGYFQGYQYNQETNDCELISSSGCSANFDYDNLIQCKYENIKEFNLTEEYEKKFLKVMQNQSKENFENNLIIQNYEVQNIYIDVSKFNLIFKNSSLKLNSTKFKLLNNTSIGTNNIININKGQNENCSIDIGINNFKFDSNKEKNYLKLTIGVICKPNSKENLDLISISNKIGPSKRITIIN